MRRSFCLLNQPWVPCISMASHHQELSLTETLINAPSIAEIHDPSPLVTIALHRLLLAILYRALDPLDEAKWVSFWKGDNWPEQQIKAYLEQWAERFDLFHPQHPFFQTIGLPEQLASPISRLSQSQASGARNTLFDHTIDAHCGEVPPAQAARWLIAYQPFCLSGRLGDGIGLATVRSGPLAHSAVFLPTGHNLAETLLLNLLPDAPEMGNKAIPLWEESQPIRHEMCSAQGFIELLTWPSRRIWLDPPMSINGGISRVIVCGGRELSHDKLVVDPMIAYRRGRSAGSKTIRRPLRLPRRSAWWQLRAALLARSRPDLIPPANLLWVAELAACGVLDTGYCCGLSVFGLRAEKARIDAWGHYRQSLPVLYLEDSDLAADLERALEIAEVSAAALQRAKAKVQDNPSEAADYWTRLYSILPRLLNILPGNLQHRDAVLLWWAETCAQTAWEVFQAMADKKPWNSRQLPHLVQARKELVYGLHDRLLKPYR